MPISLAITVSYESYVLQSNVMASLVVFFACIRNSAIMFRFQFKATLTHTNETNVVSCLLTCAFITAVFFVLKKKRKKEPYEFYNLTWVNTSLDAYRLVSHNIHVLQDVVFLLIINCLWIRQPPNETSSLDSSYEKSSRFRVPTNLTRTLYIKT